MDTYLIWTLQSMLPMDLSVEWHSSLNKLLGSIWDITAL